MPPDHDSDSPRRRGRRIPSGSMTKALARGARLGGTDVGLIHWQPMIKYPDGSVPRKGDRVDYDGYAAVVEDVIDTEAKRREWGVDKSGLMLETEAFGLVFEPEHLIDWDSVRFVARGSTSRGPRP